MTRTCIAAVLLGALCAAPARAATRPTLERLAPRLAMSGPLELPRRKVLYQRTPKIAYGGGRFLLVWQEGYHGLGGASDILGLRIGRDGVPLDREAIRICTAKSVQVGPAVAFANGRFLVVWADFRNGNDYDVYAALVGADGTVRTPFLVAGGRGGQAAPAVASDGKSTFFVAWQDHRGGKQFDTYGARVSADGSVLDKGGRLLIPGGELPAVGFNGVNYFVGLGRTGCLVGRDGAVQKVVSKLWRVKRSVRPPAILGAWGKALVLWNIAPRPDPWGWGGNGSIIGVSVTPDGRSPEYGAARHSWYTAARDRANRATKNVIDAARWRNQNDWPMGMPGGFKGSHEGTWPSGRVAAAYNGRSLLVVWNRAHFVSMHALGQRDLFLKRVLDGWAYVDEPKLVVVAGPTDEINPALAADAAGNALLAYEKQQPAGGLAIEYRVLREDEDRDPPRVVYVARRSPEEMIVGFDEPVDPASVSAAGNFAIEGIEVKAARMYRPHRGLMRQVLLRTAPQRAGAAYVLRVRGVRDLSPARNAAAGRPFRYVCKPGVSQDSDFIERWCIVGAFPNHPKVEFVDPATVHPSPGDVVKGKGAAEVKPLLRAAVAAEKFDWNKGDWEAQCEKVFAGDKRWRAFGTQGACLLRLSRAYGSLWAAAAYANTYVFSDREREILLRVDSNDGHRVWLNGKRLYDDLGVGRGRGIHSRTNETPATLRKGWNQLLIRVGNHIGRWLLVAQITDRNRQPIRDLTYQLENPFR